jgi:hypothetical protein
VNSVTSEDWDRQEFRRYFLARQALEDGGQQDTLSGTSTFGQNENLRRVMFNRLKMHALRVADIGASTTIWGSPHFIVADIPADRSDPATFVDVGTDAALIRRRIARSVTALLLIAQDEKFHVGYNSNFSAGIEALIRRDHEYALAALREGLQSHRSSIFVIAELMQLFGRLDHELSRGLRVGFMVGYLGHESAVIRDAAATALGCLDEKSAIPFIEQAIAREQSASLRADMEAVREQLAG